VLAARGERRAGPAPSLGVTEREILAVLPSGFSTCWRRPGAQNGSGRSRPAACASTYAERLVLIARVEVTSCGSAVNGIRGGPSPSTSAWLG